MSSLLNTAAMENNLAEKVDESPLKRGRWVLLVYNWDRENSNFKEELHLFSSQLFSTGAVPSKIHFS